MGYNTFAYCGNNPVIHTDSRGNAYERTGGFGGYPNIGSATGGAGTAIVNTAVTACAVSKALTTVGAREEVFSYRQYATSERALYTAKAYARSISDNNNKYVVHHIVAKRDHRAAPAQAVLASVGIDPMTYGLNLAVIPQERHVSLHTDSYFMYVNNKFEKLAGNEDAIINALAELQMEIQIYCQTGLKGW